MFITLAQAKQHLNLTDFSDDDEYITTLILIAEDVVEKHINQKLTDVATNNDGVLPYSLFAALQLFIGNLYANRETVAFGKATELKFNYAYLLDLNQSI